MTLYSHQYIGAFNKDEKLINFQIFFATFIPFSTNALAERGSNG